MNIQQHMKNRNQLKLHKNWQLDSKITRNSLLDLKLITCPTLFSFFHKFLLSSQQMCIFFALNGKLQYLLILIYSYLFIYYTKSKQLK